MLSLRNFLLYFYILFSAIDLAGSERFELRGILDLSGHERFSIHDLETENTFWLPLGGERYGLSVVEYRKETGLLKLDTPTGRVDLSIRRSDGEPLGVVTDASLRSDREARQVWISGSVKNPRLGNLIRDRRSRGAINNSSLTKGVASSSNSSQHAQQSSADQVSGEADQIESPEIAGAQDSDQLRFNHGNPRVLVAKEKDTR